ncbi:hypothetical protein AX17_001126 [Amanita inopinata Kibby_2008]|nr:hypothetical protein AX17_001126 [Amanita inopinata Kibby_2008]
MHAQGNGHFAALNINGTAPVTTSPSFFNASSAARNSRIQNPSAFDATHDKRADSLNDCAENDQESCVDEELFASKPNNKDPWTQCHELIQNHDKEMCDAWRSEVDNLLLFAGLFSGVVTPFTVQSFNWLRQDSTKDAAQLLERISRQLDHEVLPPLDMTPSTPSWPVIRINILWFLTLTLSLSTAFIGILCIQWIRHYQRRTEASNHKDAISLRQMRYEGLIWWHVPEVLAALHFMIQTAVLLFLGGTMELLWLLDTRVAIPVTIVIGLILGVIILTSAIPTAQFLFRAEKRFNIPPCPYKSSISWIYSRGSIRILHTIISVFERLLSKDKQSLPRTNKDSRKPDCKTSQEQEGLRSRLKLISDHRSWAEFDECWQRVRECTPEAKQGSGVGSEDLVNGLHWVYKTFSQSTEVIHVLYHCIRDLHPRTVAEVLSKIHPENFGTKVVDREVEEEKVDGLKDSAALNSKDTWLAIYLQKHVRAHRNLAPDAAATYCLLAKHSTDHKTLESLDFPDYLIKQALHNRKFPCETARNVICATKIALERDTIVLDHLEHLFLFTAIALKFTTEPTLVKQLQGVVEETFMQCEAWIAKGGDVVNGRPNVMERTNACCNALLKLYDKLEDDHHHITPILTKSTARTSLLMQYIKPVVVKLQSHAIENSLWDDPRWMDLISQVNKLSS